MNEEWRDIPGYEGYYQVSNLGRVKSLPRIVPMSDGRMYTCRERFLKTSFTGFYCHVVLSQSGREATLLMHRLVLESFVGLCPDGMECCHEDGDTKNNHLDNRRWDTRQSNSDDKYEHGTDLTGRLGNAYKLTNEDAEEIKRLRAEGHTGRVIAEKFGVTIKTVWNVVGGRRKGTHTSHRASNKLVNS